MAGPGGLLPKEVCVAGAVLAFFIRSGINPLDLA
jgi:hypothetical protein